MKEIQTIKPSNAIAVFLKRFVTYQGRYSILSVSFSQNKTAEPRMSEHHQNSHGELNFIPLKKWKLKKYFMYSSCCFQTTQSRFFKEKLMTF